MNNVNLPKEIKDELIDLSGLKDEEILEKMKEIFSNSKNMGSRQFLDEYHSFHKKLDKVSHRRATCKGERKSNCVNSKN